MIKYFIHNGIAVTVLCIFIFLFGFITLFRLPIQLTPDVNLPSITVTTIYPGATPQDVEQDILVKQEGFLKGLTNLKKMTSTASMGMGEIVLEFSVNSNQDENLILVNNALSQVSGYPENVDEPNLSTSASSNQPVAFFSIRPLPGKEKEINIEAERDYAEDFIKPRFERVPGVGGIMGVFGGSPEEMQVYIDPVKLADRGLTIYQVRDAIRRNNRDTSGGDLSEGKRRYNVRTLGRYEKPEDVENTIITVEGTTPIYIRDVGYARLGTAKMRSLIRHNGTPALGFGVRRQPGSNLLTVMEEVKKVKDELNNGILKDRGLYITQVTDDTEYVGEAVDMVRSNMLQGGFLAILTLLLILRHLRSTSILALAVPFCVMGSFLLISMTGRSINVISLAGLAFSVGSVLDASIVVLENIFRHRQMGKDPYVAALDGTAEVWTAILASVVTNVVVFVPIIMLKEQVGQIFKDLAIAIVAANMLGLAFSVLVIPAMSARLLKKMTETSHEEGFIKQWHNLFGLMPHVSRSYDGIGRSLEWLMGSARRRLVTAGGLTGVAILLIFVFMPKSEYLPEGNQNAIFAMIIPPQGYNIEEMSAIGRSLESRFAPYVNGTMEDYRAGKLDGPPIRDFFFVAYGNGMFIFSQAKDPTLAKDVPPLIQRILSGVPGMITVATQRSIFESDIRGSRGIELDIVGPDVRTLTYLGLQSFLAGMQSFPRDAQGQPQAQLRPIPGIEIGQPQLSITPKWEQAAALGISASAIGYGAWVLGDGAYADNFYKDGRELDLYLYSTMEAFDTLSNFDTLRIATDTGETVPISQVADISFAFEPEQIRRVDQQRAVTIQIIPSSKISLEDAINVVKTKMIGALESEGKVPPGYNLRIGGSSDKLAAVRQALAGEFLLALILVYLTMVLIFHHWGHPLTIMLSVPVGLTGGVLGLWLLNMYLRIISPGTIQAMDVLTMLGFVILLGCVVNNPILIVAQTLNFMRAGMPRRKALVGATLSRLRPIIMSSGATVFALLPLVLNPGAGSELYRGLGVVVFGGLFLGTIVTIYLIPSFFELNYDLKEFFTTRRGKEAGESEAIAIPVRPNGGEEETGTYR
ncbi:MAG: efflux RND transporter permease subunit [bacterium]